jgi:hypothetical protein
MMLLVMLQGLIATAQAQSRALHWANETKGQNNKKASLFTFHKEYGQCRCEKSQHDTNNQQTSLVV